MQGYGILCRGAEQRLRMAHGITILAVQCRRLYHNTHSPYMVTYFFPPWFNSPKLVERHKISQNCESIRQAIHPFVVSTRESRRTRLDVRISPHLNPFTQCSSDDNFIGYWGGASHHESRERHSVKT